MSTSDVLQRVCMNNFLEGGLQVYDASFPCIERLVKDFIDDKIDYDTCCIECLRYVNDIAPLQRLYAIIQTKDEPPIPYTQNWLGFAGMRKKVRTWSATEDNRLLMGVYVNGLEAWGPVSAFVGNGRTRSQCAQRWVRVLDPSICKANWSREEEILLVKYVQEFGEKNWIKVAKAFGNRSDVQCRYHYQMMEKRDAEPNDNNIKTNDLIRTITLEELEQEVLTKQPIMQFNTEENNLRLREPITNSFEMFNSNQLFDSTSYFVL